MAETDKQREAIGETAFPPIVEKALKDVTELPEDLDKQAEFFDKVQQALTNRLRDDS